MIVRTESTHYLIHVKGTEQDAGQGDSVLHERVHEGCFRTRTAEKQANPGVRVWYYEPPDADHGPVLHTIRD